MRVKVFFLRAFHHTRELQVSNFSIEVRANEPFEKSLRRFSVQTKKSGILRDLKRKRFYTKPSAQKKIDLQRSIRRQKKAELLASMTHAEKRKLAETKREKRQPRR